MQFLGNICIFLPLQKFQQHFLLSSGQFGKRLVKLSLIHVALETWREAINPGMRRLETFKQGNIKRKNEGRKTNLDHPSSFLTILNSLALLLIVPQPRGCCFLCKHIHRCVRHGVEVLTPVIVDYTNHLTADAAWDSQNYTNVF